MRVCGVRRRRRRDFRFFRLVLTLFFFCLAETLEVVAPAEDTFELTARRLLCTLSRRRCADDCDCGAVFVVVVVVVVVIVPPECAAVPAAALFALVLALARLMFFSFDDIVMGSRWHGLEADAKANGECGSMPMLVTAAEAAAAAAAEVEVDGKDAADDDWR